MERRNLEDLIDKKLSQRELAKELNCSQATIKYWLKKYDLKTKKNRYGLNQPEAGPQTPCKHHGLDRMSWVSNAKRWRCKQCWIDKIANQRHDLKRELVEMLGGKCSACEYDRCYWAMHFHHINPSTKIDTIGNLISDRKFKQARQEALKCKLLCANCHAEEEASKLGALV